MTPFEYVGQWWLPETPETTCCGTLRFDGTNTPELKVLGPLRPMARGIGGSDPFTPDIILGFTENGKEVTLYGCYETHTGLSFPGIPTFTYIANYAIVGSHFTSKDKVLFEKFWIRHDRLIEWAQLAVFKDQFDWEGESLRRINVTWRPPEPFEVTVAGWEVRFAHGFQQRGDRLEQYSLEHQIRLEVTPAEPKSGRPLHRPNGLVQDQESRLHSGRRPGRTVRASIIF